MQKFRNKQFNAVETKDNLNGPKIVPRNTQKTIKKLNSFMHKNNNKLHKKKETEMLSIKRIVSSNIIWSSNKELLTQENHHVHYHHLDFHLKTPPLVFLFLLSFFSFSLRILLNHLITLNILNLPRSNDEDSHPHQALLPLILHSSPS